MTDEEMQDYFPAVYPKMFSGKYGGIAVGKGWFGILTQLCQAIQSHVDWRATQYKQAINYNKMAHAGQSGNAELFADLCAVEYGDNGFDAEYVKNRLAEILNDPLRVIPEECEQVEVKQLKEKFGSLRFYYTGGDDYISGLVSMAESMTDITCEECGAPGTQGGTGWVSTLCETHRAERDAADGKCKADWEAQEAARTKIIKAEGHEE